MQSFYKLLELIENQEPQLPADADNMLSPSLPQELTLNAWVNTFDSLVEMIESDVKKANIADNFIVTQFLTKAKKVSNLYKSLSKSPYDEAKKRLTIYLNWLYELKIPLHRLSKYDIPSAEYLDNFLINYKNDIKNLLQKAIYPRWMGER